MRVLYLIDSLGRGGAEVLLTAYLGQMAQRGVDPIVIALQNRGGNPTAREIEALGIPVVDLGIERLRQRGAYRQVVAAIERSQPDLVHTQLEFSNILGAAAASRLGLPVVSTLHSLEEPRALSRAWLRMHVMAWSLRRHANRVIAVSDHARAHHLRHLRLPGDLVQTIYNGIDTDRFRSDVPDARAELGIPPDVPLIVTVAVLRPPKGIDLMLRAMPEVPDAHYLIVGDGEARLALEAETARLGLGDRVTFAGARADIPVMLATADLFVLPSLTEALPTVIAEAMAAGLPVVATDVGGTTEMVDADTGIVVDAGDADQLANAVRSLLADPIRAGDMGRTGREIAARRFDLHNQAGRLIDEYRRLGAARRP
jgi:glycosyltransferase involved in cell wall biosynthesis